MLVFVFQFLLNRSTEHSKTGEMSFWVRTSPYSTILSVVYFDQRLDAAHPKCWSKKSISAFFLLKS